MKTTFLLNLICLLTTGVHARMDEVSVLYIPRLISGIIIIINIKVFVVCVLLLMQMVFALNSQLSIKFCCNL